MMVNIIWPRASHGTGQIGALFLVLTKLHHVRSSGTVKVFALYDAYINNGDSRPDRNPIYFERT